MRTFEVTLSGRGNRTAFIVADRVLRIEEPVDGAYERDVRARIVQEGDVVNVQESAREAMRRYEACFVEIAEATSK
ncbi:MAG TPA: hypothetical protein VF521_01065 [Pyrinomonadaceae bacterium]|jgi:hypothetical protein